MTGIWFLDTAVLAVSLFNAMLLVWLGIVVLSSADRRSWGIWLTSAGLLCSGGFFLIHSAIIGLGLHQASPDLDWMWHLGWISLIASPLAWYIVMLWYVGYFDAPRKQKNALRQTQTPGLVLTIGCAFLLIGVLVFTAALPTFDQVLSFGRFQRTVAPVTPFFIALHALYNILCLSLSVHALQHPEPSARWMGDLARRRARPWLTAASVVLLGVSLFVSAFLVALYFALTLPFPLSESQARVLLTIFDGMIAALIAVAVVLIGKATVSYENFTGKTLPRRGFFRQWRRAVILAAGYSTLIAATITFALPPMYALIVATLLIVFFFALLSVRMFGERERSVRELRPLLTKSESISDSDAQIRAPFDTLCKSVLNVRVGYLCPLAPLAAPLAYPSKLIPPLAEAMTLVSRFQSPDVSSIAIEPAAFKDAVWAIPLWNARGLQGLLLLGERNDGGLYAQEEIEIAQATGERVLEAQASAELTRRLIELQRARLATTQVMDRRARRVLHDDILPQLHTALLELNANGNHSNGTEAALTELSKVHRALSNLVREMPAGSSPQLERDGVLNVLRRTAEDEFGSAFDSLTWQIDPESEQRLPTLAPLNAEVLYAAAREAIRNAAKHGRGAIKSRPLHISICAQWREGLNLEIQDDGVGFNVPPSGSGQGLALHSTMLAVIGGEMTIERVERHARAAFVFAGESVGIIV